MKLKLRSAIAGVATLAIAGGGLLSLATAASAAPTTPPWEPDANSAAPYGNVVFYDSAGNVVTSGTNLNHLFDYVAATTPGDTGATKATLYFAAPNHALATGQWAVNQQSASNTFPNASAPAPLTGPGFTNPVDSLGATDANLTAALGAVTLDSTSGYANLIQVRMKDSGGGGVTSGSNYWSADIAYNTGSSPITVDGVSVPANGWAQVYPVVTTTTTSLAASPASPQNLTGTQTQGQTVTLTATVSPAQSGTVQFFDGTTSLGTSPVSGGTATGSLPTPAEGTHNLTAKFIPTGGTEVQGSTSSVMAYQVVPPQTATNTSLAGPASVNQYSSGTWTATVTAADSTTQPGNVVFTATGTGTTTGTTTLGTVAETTGTAALTVSSVTLAPGTYNVTAAFTPTSSSYATSTSQPVALTVASSPCPGTPVAGASCSDTQNITTTVNPGSLTITTPYTAAKPFVLPAMALNAAATELQTSGQFPAATDPQIEVHSSLAGDPAWTVSVTDSDLSCASGSCTTPVNGDYQSINGENLGLTAGHTTTALPSAAFPGSVSFTDIPADSTVVGPADGGSNGLKGGPHTFAHSPAGNGTVDLYGTLSLNAPTATQAGTYTGTITFTVG